MKRYNMDANARQYHIAVAGTGYVGLSIATLLAQHNQLTAVDIVSEKVELINNCKSPVVTMCFFDCREMMQIVIG